MPNICAEYSGVVLNQNIVTTPLAAGSNYHYQTFRLPENYLYGTDGDEQRYPSLSGFQLLVAIAEGQAASATLNYTVEQFFFGSGWGPLAKGTVVGAQSDGERVWMDVIFGKEIPVDASMTTNVSELRIGFQAVSGIEEVYYAHPNPLPGFVEGFQSDGSTPLSPPGSFCFRLLALTADSGTDFLGNPYRSVAIHAQATNPSGNNTNAGYWLSGPQPSRFAVVSHYSDLRPFPEKPTFGTINFVPDPNFEYDKVGSPPAEWKVRPDIEEDARPTQPAAVLTKAGEWKQTLTAVLNFDDWDTKAVATVVNSQAFIGSNSLQVTTASHLANVHHEREGVHLPIEVFAGEPITFSGYARCVGSGFSMVLKIGDQHVGIAETVFTVTSEWTRWSVTLTPTSTALSKVSVLTLPVASVAPPGGIPAESAHTFYLDAMMINKGAIAAKYFDGDSLSAKWTNQRGRSGSVELIEPTVEDDAVVVDGILIDPITPGVAFNIYYTTDLTGSEEGEMTEEQWEQKLWIHVPKSYITTTAQTYLLPEPITAKFIKIEFSHLQSRSYNPGDFQRPLKYKLFPDWVATPFLAEVTLPNFVARKVGVAHDALELAYEPLLEDLVQAPLRPQNPLATVVGGPAANLVDPDTLKKINLVINTYQFPPAARADTSTLLGQNAALHAKNAPNYPVEGQSEFFASPVLAVSTLDRQAIVLDQSMPVMFFWVTCRHEYKELYAKLDNNRAYFAGLNEIAFIRNTYTTVNDGDLYIEAGADDINTERSDFDIEEGTWFTY